MKHRVKQKMINKKEKNKKIIKEKKIERIKTWKLMDLIFHQNQLSKILKTNIGEKKKEIKTSPAEYEWGSWDTGETGYIKLNKTQFTNVGWKTQNSLSSVTFSSKGKVQNEVVHTIDHTDDRLQTCYFIRVKNSAISRAEYEYYATRNQLSSNMGGLFSPMPTELPTNIHCINGSMKAVGFVGIRGKVNEAEIHILKKNVYYEDTHKKVSPPDELFEGKSPLQLWNEGYRILFYDPNDHRVRWTYAWWVDCRVAPWFASLSKPPFWNDNWTKE